MGSFRGSSQASWVNKAPADMSYDELAEASKAVRARLDELSPLTNNLNSTNAALTYEVSQRFGLPGFGGSPGNYPQDWVSSYDWSSSDPNTPSPSPSPTPADPSAPSNPSQPSA